MIAPPELTKDEIAAVKMRAAVIADRMGGTADPSDILVREVEKRVVAKARGATVECQACSGVGYHFTNGERL